LETSLNIYSYFRVGSEGDSVTEICDGAAEHVTKVNMVEEGERGS